MTADEKLDTKRLEFLMEQCICYIYIGEENDARDLKTRKQIDKAMKDQDEDLS